MHISDGILSTPVIVAGFAGTALVVKGKGHDVQKFANKVVRMRGIKHGKLTMTTTGKLIPSKVDRHSHS